MEMLHVTLTDTAAWINAKCWGVTCCDMAHVGEASAESVDCTFCGCRWKRPVQRLTGNKIEITLVNDGDPSKVARRVAEQFENIPPYWDGRGGWKYWCCGKGATLLAEYADSNCYLCGKLHVRPAEACQVCKIHPRENGRAVCSNKCLNYALSTAMAQVGTNTGRTSSHSHSFSYLKHDTYMCKCGQTKSDKEYVAWVTAPTYEDYRTSFRIDKADVKRMNDQVAGQMQRISESISACVKLCLNCNKWPRLSAEANLCTECAAHGCNANPIAAQSVFYEGVNREPKAPSLNAQAKYWYETASALLGPTAKPETLALVKKEIEQATANLPVLNFTCPVDVPPLPPCPFEGLVPGPDVSPSYYFDDEDRANATEELAMELFNDQLWNVALKHAEGREDRLHDVLKKMWSRPEHAAVRVECSAKAKRIVGRR